MSDSPPLVGDASDDSEASTDSLVQVAAGAEQSHSNSPTTSHNTKQVTVQSETTSSSANADASSRSRNRRSVWLIALMDRFLQDYVKFTSTATNQDVSLKLLQWTLWLASYLKRSSDLRKLSIDLSFARYALRLLGLPPSLEAARTNSWSSVPRAPWLGNIMAWSMVGYYPLEHLAYLGWQTPQLLKSQRAEKWSAWSCRCWLVYIVADLVQSTMKLIDLKKEEERAVLALNSSTSSRSTETHDNETCKQDDKDEESVTEIATTSSTTTSLSLALLQKAIRFEQLQVVRSLLFAAPAIHWSLPRWHTHPWLKEPVVNGLMWAEAVVSMAQRLLVYQRD